MRMYPPYPITLSALFIGGAAGIAIWIEKKYSASFPVVSDFFILVYFAVSTVTFLFSAMHLDECRSIFRRIYSGP